MDTDANEEKIYEWFAKVRTGLLKPLAKLLASLHITPDMISYSSLMVMTLFIFTAGYKKELAFLLILVVLFLDSLDGSLARYLKSGSDRGKFTDTLVDTTNFVLFMVGVAAAGLVEGWAAVLYVYFAVTVKVLLIIKRSLHRKSDWLIHPRAGALPHNFIYASYLMFGIYAFSSRNYLEITTVIFAICLIYTALRYYWQVRNATFTN